MQQQGIMWALGTMWASCYWQNKCKIRALQTQNNADEEMEASVMQQPDVLLAPVHRDVVTAAIEVKQKVKWLGDGHVDHAQHLLGSTFQ